MIVRISALKYENLNELHKSVEKFIKEKVKNYFEPSKKKKDTSNVIEDEVIYIKKENLFIYFTLKNLFSKYSDFIENYDSKLYEIFTDNLAQKQSGIMNIEDYSITTKSLIKILEVL